MKGLKSSIIALTLPAMICCTAMEVAGKDPYRVSIVVVFKKNVDESTAVKILERRRYIFSPDRGRQYSREAGPAFILYVHVDRRDAIMSKIRKMPEVREVFAPVRKTPGNNPL